MDVVVLMVVCGDVGNDRYSGDRNCDSSGGDCNCL